VVLQQAIELMPGDDALGIHGEGLDRIFARLFEHLTFLDVKLLSIERTQASRVQQLLVIRLCALIEMREREHRLLVGPEVSLLVEPLSVIEHILNSRVRALLEGGLPARDVAGVLLRVDVPELLRAVPARAKGLSIILL